MNLEIFLVNRNYFLIQKKIYSRNIKIVTKVPRFLFLSTKQIADCEIDKITTLSGLRRGPCYFRERREEILERGEWKRRKR